MKTLNFLGMDYGASNGKGVIGCFDGNLITLNELNRFYNYPIILPKGLYWNIFSLYSELKKSIIAAWKRSIKIHYIGIDSWAQDFGIIDKQGNLLGIPHNYRDIRHQEGFNKVINKYSEYELFMKTGIVPNEVCTLFQLISMKQYEKSILENAFKMMFIPNLLTYFLTGEISCDSSIASMSLMYNVSSHTWIQELTKEFNLPDILPEITLYSKTVGKIIDPELRQICERDIPVINIAQHDTMSAFLTASAFEKEETVYISCGTWAMIGAPIEKPIKEKKAFQNGFSNEVGYDNQVYLTKNLTGLWIFQECIKEWEREGYSVNYDYLDSYAEKSKFSSFINPEDEIFIQPYNMSAKIINFCKITEQNIPSSREEIYICILRGLADRMSKAVEELEQITGVGYNRIHIIGGGSKIGPLCKLINEYTGKQVFAGPHEATVIGNIISQAISSGEIGSIREAGEVIYRSFSVIHHI